MTFSLLSLQHDAEILERIQQGDERALLALFRSSRRVVTAFILRNSGTREDADDMLQEALIVLWERVRSGRFRHEARLETFIMATVKNMWLRQLARARRFAPEGEADPMADDGLSPLDALIDTEETARVAGAMAQLGSLCRELLLLFYWERRPMQEIAARLGLANADTAKSKKYQCKQQLGALLARTRAHA